MNASFLNAQPKRLLVCTDGSSASRGAIEASFVLAKRPGRIRVLQVLEYNPGFASQAINHIHKWEQEVREGLRGILARAKASGMEADMVVRQGESADYAILAEADVWQPDLIVMGRHGRTGLTGILMGSVTARVIGHSRVNVLVAPRQSPLSFTRLLVASDGSHFSQAAWREALSLATAWSSQLLAVSVARRKSEFPECKKILGKLQDEADRQALPLSTFMLQGVPEEAIIQTAQAQRADLVILGSHGRTGLKRFLMGSVAEQVIGKALCPVLVVKRLMKNEERD